VDAVGGEVNAGMLIARIRKERHGAGASPFVLDVSIEVPPGITILFGASGAGKSTLLDCIAGLARPDEGQIASGGDVLFDSAVRINVPISKRRIAYVFQTLALFPHLSAEQNVAYGLKDLPEKEKPRAGRSNPQSFSRRQTKESKARRDFRRREAENRAGQIIGH